MARNATSADETTDVDLLHWDAERDEPYLWIPNHANLRIVPMSAGMEDQLVSPKSPDYCRQTVFSPGLSLACS